MVFYSYKLNLYTFSSLCGLIWIIQTTGFVYFGSYYETLLQYRDSHLSGSSSQCLSPVSFKYAGKWIGTNRNEKCRTQPSPYLKYPFSYTTLNGFTIQLDPNKNYTAGKIVGTYMGLIRNSGVLTELRKRMYFIPNSEKKKEKRKFHMSRWRLELQQKRREKREYSNEIVLFSQYSLDYLSKMNKTLNLYKKSIDSYFHMPRNEST